MEYRSLAKAYRPVAVAAWTHHIPWPYPDSHILGTRSVRPQSAPTYCDIHHIIVGILHSFLPMAVLTPLGPIAFSWTSVAYTFPSDVVAFSKAWYPITVLYKPLVMEFSPYSQKSGGTRRIDQSCCLVVHLKIQRLGVDRSDENWPSSSCISI